MGLADDVAQVALQVILEGGCSGAAEHAAEEVALLEEGDIVTALGSDTGGLYALAGPPPMTATFFFLVIGGM